MDPSDEPAPRHPACLLVRSGAHAGTRFALRDQETLIGRGPGTDVMLSDDGVSREHALLCFDEAAGVWMLEDLQSTNGTRVNGKRIRSVALQPEDELQIGRTRISFVVE
jgi:pSer/pThr/pTyr-binding forkhead associated (FHA) protein